MEKGTSEIAKLTERISKDPKSKLFVPLAEEYKKTGDIEMAIAVLTEGLKNNPGYVTAKSFLGRLLLDKGNLSEAQKEFEEVVKAIPDNVLAQRKLGDIHALQGRAQEALLFFKAVLAVNPKDPELNALVADIEAGRDVREKIAGPKYQPVAGQAAVAAGVPTAGPSAAAAPLPLSKPSAPAVPTKPQAVPVSIPSSVDAEEPEEVLVFESLDEVAPAGVLQRSEAEATQDIFADMAAETAPEEAARMDEGLAGEGLATETSVVPQPVSDSDAGMMPLPDLSSAAVMEHGSGSPDAGLGNSFFDSEPASIESPATAPAASAPAADEGFGLPDTGPGNSFFDSESAPIDSSSSDSGGFDVAGTSEVSAGAEHAPGFPDAGLSDNMFFDSGPMPAEPQKTADALDFPAPEVPLGEQTETVSADDRASEALFFDAEPVEATAELRTPQDLNAAEESTPATLDVPESGQGSSVPEEAASGGLLFDVEPDETALLSAHAGDSGQDVAVDGEAALFGEALPEADDFTTDTLAELYIAQGFYEKAIEIYERMLADRPNSKLLRDKLANVRAMGSASGTDEEQGTPVLFEAPGSSPIPSPQPLSADVARQWTAPGAEAAEYISPPADDFESAAFDSGFAPVEYVLPETPESVPQPSVGQKLQVHDAEPQPASLKTAASEKEQTIAKLDNWLKNILKEK